MGFFRGWDEDSQVHPRLKLLALIFWDLLRLIVILAIVYWVVKSLIK